MLLSWKLLQQREGPLGREALVEPGEADDVGEQHGHVADRGSPEIGGRALRESVGDVGRDVAGEVRSQDLGLHLGEKMHAASVDRDRQESREDAGGDELRQPLRQADVGRD